MFELYIVTDEKINPSINHEMIAEAANTGGADLVQLRDKYKNSRELYETAQKLRKICDKSLFIINDRLDIALACNADGVHLGQSDLPLAAARKLVPRPFIIGISIQSVNDAISAEKDGADYVVISPVFDTGSKDDAGEGLGTELIREVKKAVKIPVLGIGGINLINAVEVIKAGADGIAVISAVIKEPDMIKATATLKSEIVRIKKER